MADISIKSPAPSSNAATYSHGHHSTVISVHARRTAQNSAAFLLPHLKPTDRILDLGCGPGTITADLAALVPQGSVIGVDAVDSILDQARSLAQQRNLNNLTYETGDANKLRFKDGEFDVVFCHQLLQHVSDPVGVLKEMKRCCRSSGGLVAAREADYASFVWFPRLPELDRWGQIYQAVARRNGGEPNAGRAMVGWMRRAGWDVSSYATLQQTGETKEKGIVSWNSWCFTGQDAKDWAASWSGRSVHSDFAKGAVKHGFASEEEMKGISEAWLRWGADGEVEGWEDRIFVVGNGEVLCWC